MTLYSNNIYRDWLFGRRRCFISLFRLNIDILVEIILIYLSALRLSVEIIDFAAEFQSGFMDFEIYIKFPGRK